MTYALYYCTPSGPTFFGRYATIEQAKSATLQMLTWGGTRGLEAPGISAACYWHIEPRA